MAGGEENTDSPIREGKEKDLPDLEKENPPDQPEVEEFVTEGK
jgi:hypothetical protein